MIKRFVVCLAMLLASCTSQIRTAPINLDPDFTVEETELIVSAIDEWFYAIPEAATTVEIGGGVNFLRMTESKTSKRGNLILGESNVVRTWIYIGEARPVLRAVVLHEMGHRLGHLEHNASGYATDEWSGAGPNCITARDIELVCEARGGCTEPTFPTCK